MSQVHTQTVWEILIGYKVIKNLDVPHMRLNLNQGGLEYSFYLQKRFEIYKYIKPYVRINKQQI